MFRSSLECARKGREVEMRVWKCSQSEVSAREWSWVVTMSGRLIAIAAGAAESVTRIVARSTIVRLMTRLQVYDGLRRVTYE
jgi:hypothetical protein